MRHIRGHRGLALVLGAAMAVLPGAVHAQSSSPGTDPGLDSALAAVELMNAIPVGVRETCQPSTVTLDGIVTSAECQVGQGVGVYARLDDLSSLHAAYDMVARMTGLDPDTGSACRDGPFEGEYSLDDGTVAGRLVCQTAPDGGIAVWTDDANLVLGVVQLIDDQSFDHIDDAFRAAHFSTVAATAASPSAAETPIATPMTAVPTATAAASAGATSAAASLPAAGADLSQWASSAVASTQYDDDPWSATQATGAPDTSTYGDTHTAWAPEASDVGEQWLELTYDTAVIPSGVTIWETSGNGFVVKIEAFDETTGTWLPLWQGVDDSPAQVHGFSPTLERADVATSRLRISADTDVPGWNEIDAVELRGATPS